MSSSPPQLLKKVFEIYLDSRVNLCCLPNFFDNILMPFKFALVIMNSIGNACREQNNRFSCD